MERRRFVLRYCGPGPKPEADAERVRECSEVTVLGETPKMILIESDTEAAVGRLIDSIAGWVAAPQSALGVTDA